MAERYENRMESQAESTPELEHHAIRPFAFISNTSACRRRRSTDYISSRSGPSAGSSSASRSSDIGEPRSADLPGSSNVKFFEDRMKRWAERSDQKKRQKALRKNMSSPAAAQVVTADGQAATTPTLKEQHGVQAGVQELLIQKGLPIVSLELIGSGNFGKVYKGIWTQDKPGSVKTQSMVAVKVIKSTQSRSRLGQDGSLIPPKWLEREVKISLAQHHKNLVRVIESPLDSLPYVIVLEYCPGGSLHESIIGDPSDTLQRFTWEHRLKAALDIALGMAHLHEQRIMHRDLKTQNVLLLYPVLSPGDAVLAKVCDFGLARCLPSDDFQTQLTHQVGSWYYMAPEMLDSDSKKAYDGKTDVYSYALLLYEMLAGDLHYESGKGVSFGEFVWFTFAGGRPREDAIPEGAPEVLRLLMKEAWRAKPSERPAFLEIAERLRQETCAKRPKGSSMFSLSGLAACFACLGRRHSVALGQHGFAACCFAGCFGAVFCLFHGFPTSFPHQNVLFRLTCVSFGSFTCTASCCPSHEKACLRSALLSNSISLGLCVAWWHLEESNCWLLVVADILFQIVSAYFMLDGWGCALHASITAMIAAIGYAARLFTQHGTAAGSSDDAPGFARRLRGFARRLSLSNATHDWADADEPDDGAVRIIIIVFAIIGGIIFCAGVTYSSSRLCKAREQVAPGTLRSMASVAPQSAPTPKPISVAAAQAPAQAPGPCASVCGKSNLQKDKPNAPEEGTPAQAADCEVGAVPVSELPGVVANIQPMAEPPGAPENGVISEQAPNPTDIQEPQQIQASKAAEAELQAELVSDQPINNQVDNSFDLPDKMKSMKVQTVGNHVEGVVSDNVEVAPLGVVTNNQPMAEPPGTPENGIISEQAPNPTDIQEPQQIQASEAAQAELQAELVSDQPINKQVDNSFDLPDEMKSVKVQTVGNHVEGVVADNVDMAPLHHRHATTSLGADAGWVNFVDGYLHRVPDSLVMQESSSSESGAESSSVETSSVEDLAAARTFPEPPASDAGHTVNLRDEGNTLSLESIFLSSLCVSASELGDDELPEPAPHTDTSLTFTRSTATQTVVTHQHYNSDCLECRSARPHNLYVPTNSRIRAMEGTWHLAAGETHAGLEVINISIGMASVVLLDKLGVSFRLYVDKNSNLLCNRLGCFEIQEGTLYNGRAAYQKRPSDLHVASPDCNSQDSFPQVGCRPGHLGTARDSMTSSSIQTDPWMVLDTFSPDWVMCCRSRCCPQCAGLSVLSHQALDFGVLDGFWQLPADQHNDQDDYKYLRVVSRWVIANNGTWNYLEDSGGRVHLQNCLVFHRHDNLLWLTTASRRLYHRVSLTDREKDHSFVAFDLFTRGALASLGSLPVFEQATRTYASLLGTWNVMSGYEVLAPAKYDSLCITSGLRRRSSESQSASGPSVRNAFDEPCVLKVYKKRPTTLNGKPIWWDAARLFWLSSQGQLLIYEKVLRGAGQKSPAEFCVVLPGVDCVS